MGKVNQGVTSWGVQSDEWILNI